MTAANLRPAVFFDRDGTLIRDVGYLTRLEQIEILDGVPAAIRALRDGGFRTVVVTNQSAVARGLLREEELEGIHQELKSRLGERGASLDGIYYCPHHPTEGMGRYRTACDCRKTNVGLAKRAAAELNLDLSRCYVVGDQPGDMEFAARIGAMGILIRGEVGGWGGQNMPDGCLFVKDFWEAASWIVQLPGRS